jgi:hypothetical protein
VFKVTDSINQHSDSYSLIANISYSSEIKFIEVHLLHAVFKGQEIEFISVINNRFEGREITRK